MYRLIALAQQLTQPLKCRAYEPALLCVEMTSPALTALSVRPPQRFREVPRKGKPRLRVPLGGSERAGRRRAGLQQPLCSAAATQTRLEASR